MSNRELYLLGSRRFLPLFVTQFLGAFNDNLFKNALVILITYRIAAEGPFSAPVLVTIAAGIFILPFFLFSASAGQIAERSEKSGLIRKIKLFEVILALLGTFGLFTDNVYFLLGVLFLLGAQSTFFGPLKYSILPDHLREDELIGGNGLIEMGTFVSILLGTIIGGLLVLTDAGDWLVSGLLIVVAAGGWLASLYIPASPAAAPDLKINFNLFTETWRMLKHSAGNVSVLRASLGISWFWLLGATYLSQFPNYAKGVIGGNEQVVTLFLTAFTLGIALGSVLCNRLVQGEITAKYVPLGALGMTFFAVDLYFASQAIEPNTERLIDAWEFFNSFQHWRVLADFSLLAACGGVFIVPLYSIIQNRSAPEHRSRNIASLNVMNALFMVISALGTTALLGAGYSIPEIFLILAVLNAAVALYTCKLLPQEVAKVFIRRLLFLLYKVEVTGLENYRKAGDRAVIVVNHVSFLDGLLLGAYLPDIPTAAMNTHIARRWWVKPALALFDIVTVDPTNPISVKTMVKVVKGGKKLIIFPEGRITVTGALMKVYEGPGTIAHLADATLVPIRIDGAQYSPFSRLRGKLPIRWFPRITLTIMPPRRFRVPEGVRGRQRRQIIGNQLYDLMVEMVFITSDLRQPLFAALLRAEQLFGGRRGVLEDVERAPVSYARLLASSLVLGRRFRQLSAERENVGVLLPNSVGAVVAFFGLQAADRVPAMLNFSAGLKNLQSACATARIKTILTSHRFIAMARLQPVIEALSETHRVIYLEDLKTELGRGDALFGLAARAFPGLCYRLLAGKPDPDQACVILFTSGSEGVPKGVVLSHTNIQANRFQLSARIDFNATDILFNALPIFHSFGLTGGLLLPLLSGIKTFLYPSPLHYRIVPELAYETNATIMFGTDTFLSGYARKAHPYDFYSIRYIFAGAERVRAETRQVYSEKFGIRLLEGYGATETSPVLAANTPMQYKPGTVGRLLPGINCRLVPVPGIERGGRLEVSGPNIMLGYLLADRPDELQPPVDGWYDTGDIVDIDDEGFITIVGRAKRFAKIAGEMVSLTAVENMVDGLWPGNTHAVVGIPDPRKGEQLVLVTDYKQANRKILSEHAQGNGIPELMVPRHIVTLDRIPVLGTGKTDYPALQTAVNDMFNKSS